MYHSDNLPPVCRGWRPQTYKLITVDQENTLTVGCNLGALLEFILVPTCLAAGPLTCFWTSELAKAMLVALMRVPCVCTGECNSVST